MFKHFKFVGALLFLFSVAGFSLQAQSIRTDGFVPHGVIDWSKLGANATSATLPVVGMTGVTVNVTFSAAYGAISYRVISPLHIDLGVNTAVDIRFSTPVEGVSATVSKHLVSQTAYDVRLFTEGLFGGAGLTHDTRELHIEGISEENSTVTENLQLVANGNYLNSASVSDSSQNLIQNSYTGISIYSFEVM